jgi:hypothetical protein
MKTFGPRNKPRSVSPAAIASMQGPTAGAMPFSFAQNSRVFYNDPAFIGLTKNS